MEQSKAGLRIIGELIDKLKSAGLFNQSFIIVVSDHGWIGNTLACSVDTACNPGRTSEYVISSGIPLFLIKPMNATPHELSTSYVPATTGDIPKTICDELKVPNTFPGYNVLDAPDLHDRIRYFYSYVGLLDEQSPNYLPPMQQYAVSNFSWSGDSWEPTYRYYSSKGIIQQYPPSINNSTIINFGRTGNSMSYLVTGGWSFPEEGFTWTMGDSSTISFEDEGADRDIFMTLSFFPYLEGRLVPVQKLYVYVNGIELHNYTIDQGGLQQLQFFIPRNLLRGRIQYITLYMPNATSPRSTGKSRDERQLGIAITSVTLTTVDSIFALFSKTWYEQEYWSGIPARWLSGNGDLLLYTGTSYPSAMLRLNVISYLKPRTLHIWKDGTRIYSVIAIPEGTKSIEIPVDIQPGKTDILFDVPEGCDRPADIEGLQNSDTRCLGIASQNLSIITRVNNTKKISELTTGS
jgi:hypothetical protein